MRFMHKANSIRMNYNKFYLVMLFVIISLHNFYHMTEVSAIPPFFSRQEIADASFDGYDINLDNNVIKKAYYNDTESELPDLRYIDYFSDGRLLNATLWLNKAFQNTPAIDTDFHYGMLIDADSNSATGLEGVDYQVDILFDTITKKWVKYLFDHSTISRHRTLALENYTSFFEKSNNFVSLSVNLDSLSSPNKYKVMFYAYVYQQDTAHFITDFSNWVDIPPPTYYILTSQNPLQLRAGDTKTIGAQLKSTTGSAPTVVEFTTIENSLPITLNIISDKSNKSYSNNPTFFNVAVSEKAHEGQYVIPILVKISTGSTFLPRFLFINNYSLSVPTEGSIFVPVNLTINVLEPLSDEERFREWWDTYGDLISLLGGGFAAGVASLVFDRLRKSRKNENIHSNH